MNTNSFNDLAARAEAGDAQAQYALAATLARGGRRAEADQWLNAAAENGYAEAKYTLATQKLQTAAGVDAAFALARSAASQGAMSAVRLLSVLYAEGLGVDRNWSAAIDLIVRAARGGDAHARLELGALIVFAGAAPLEDALVLIESALERDATAAAFYLRLCAQTGVGDAALVSKYAALLKNIAYPAMPALEKALAETTIAPPARRENAMAVLQKFAGEGAADALAHSLDDWFASRADAEEISSAPRASLLRCALPPCACDYVIASSVRRMAPSMVFDPQTGQSRRDAYRTSRTATLGVVDVDLPLLAIANRLAGLAGRPNENGEFLSVLHYRPGEEYKPHFDWLAPGPDFDRGGQRVTTALFYLNDDYEGGETFFETSERAVRGASGDVLVFHNVTEDGDRDNAARHASLLIRAGEKWLVSRWFREKKYNF